MTDPKSNYQILKQLFTFTRPYKKLFIAVAFLALLLSGIGVARTYLFKIIVNDFILFKDFKGMLQISILMLFLLLTEVSSQISFIYYANALGQNIIQDIRLALMKIIMQLKMNYFKDASVGTLVTRIVSDMERIGEVFSSGLFEIFSDLLKMIVIIGVMLYTNWKLALLVFVTMPLILYLTLWFQKSMKNAFSKVRKQVAQLNSFVQERIVGIKTIQLLAYQNLEYEKFKSINHLHKKAWLDTVWYNSIFFPCIELISSVAIAIIVWYAGFESLKGSMDLGTMLMFIQLIQMLFKPLRQISDKFSTLQMGIVAGQRVFDILNTNAPKETSKTLQLKLTQGEIRFENIQFGYTCEQLIIKNLDFCVEKGQMIAIVGTTGAGKSTLIHLINRFYDVSKGHIYIDNQDINEINLTSLRKQIALVSQDVFLFSDTIFNNITLKNPTISLEKVIQSAKEIGIDDFFNQLPENYYFNVKERGATLSAGQRQLIAFLRAYVHNPKLLILDEATSSIDSYSEKLIQKATEKITQGRTSIVIAHRLATIQKAHKIIVLHQGQIVEQGSHKQLIKNPNGFYYKLYQEQFKPLND